MNWRWLQLAILATMWLSGAAAAEPWEASLDPSSRLLTGRSLAHLPALDPLARSELFERPAVPPGPAEAERENGADEPMPLAAGLRMPAEFEPHEALLLATNELATHYPDLFCRLVSSLVRRTQVVALTGSGEEQQLVRGLLAERGMSPTSVRCIAAVHDTMWVRDYGPLCVTDDRQQRWVVDAEYMQMGRPNDDEVPAAVAGEFAARILHAQLDLEGGNLLSNGQGLLLTTTATLDLNADQGRSEDEVRHLLQRYLGADDVVFLEPLLGEPTGHVDMFAVFTSPDTVVVGAYEVAVDPANAEILDRNAIRLQGLPTPHGPLRVVRLPMPARDDGIWRTYTNGIFANGLLLVPTYPGVDDAGGRAAVALFRRLLPGWSVQGIDTSDIIELGGALHCISMQIPAGAAPVDHELPAPLVLGKPL